MKTRRLAHVSKAMFATLLLASLQFACTKKEESGTVRVTLPAAIQTAGASKASASSAVVASSTVTASSDGDSWNTAINPTVGSEINCYAVFIGGGDLSANSCSVGSSAADAQTIRFGPNIGFVPAGSEIALEAPSGGRVIYAIGLRAATTSACSNYGGTVDGANLSEPFLIATKPVNIISGPNPPITVQAALELSKKVLDCSFVGNNSGGVSAPKPFGDKRDGSISLTSGTWTAGTSTLSTGATRSGTGTLPDSKIFGASRRITNIATSGVDAGRLITTGTSFNSDSFEQGDEVAWYVAGGASNIGSPDDPVNGACGGGLYLGRFGTTKIKAIVSATQLILEQPFSGSPATIRSANLSQPPTSTNYCTIVLARVSSFDTISLSGGTNHTMNAAPFDYNGTGSGGILAVRAENISIGSGATLKISATGAGFGGGQSMLNQGEGLNSYGTTTPAPNYNGGAPGDNSSIAGGGGGNAGAGASGIGSAGGLGVGGNPLLHCSGAAVCLPLNDQKAFFGGGGGSAGSTLVGGAGGGIVLVYARNITGAGTLTVEAKGTPGGFSGGLGAGGGAGGTVGLVVQNRSGPALNLSGNGGNGGATTFTGGGGGGGVVHLHKCTATFSGGSVLLNEPRGAGGTGGSAGLSTQQDMACAIP